VRFENPLPRNKNECSARGRKTGLRSIRSAGLARSIGFDCRKTDWKFIGPASLPYAGLRTDRKEVADFFAALGRIDQTDVFEPQEFIETGEHVTVLGWTKVTARDTQKTFDTEWVQVFTVQDSKIVRWRGFANTAARYGY
jgi:uncharacterized protein